MERLQRRLSVEHYGGLSVGKLTNDFRFEASSLQALYGVLDAVAWMDCPNGSAAAQFANIDPRTAGKLLKNALQIDLVDKIGEGYVLSVAYPYKGTSDEKRAVVREALVRLPFLMSVRQFLQLGDKIEDASRKAAVLAGISNYDHTKFKPLLKWAEGLDALRPGLIPEDLVEDAETKRENRHKADITKKTAFLSHSTKDKPLIRQLAADLAEQDIDVWLDEQRIRVGDSIPEKIAQGLAQSDFFLVGISENSIDSQWVTHELNNALVREVGKRNIKILPLKLDDSPIPDIVADRKYADFSESYKQGLQTLLEAMR